MITSKDLTTFAQSHPESPKDWTPTEQEIAEMRQTAKEVNELINKCTVDTLTAILGDEDNVKAIATNVNGRTYTVVQRLHKDGLGPYREWIHWDSFDNVELQEFDEIGFENVKFYTPADEPVWMKG